ncbi:hypothetical protein D3C86_1181580 [compost metagenome]
MRVRVVRQPVGADHAAFMLEDAAHLVLVHRKVDGAGRAQALGRGGLVAAPARRNVAQVLAAAFGMRRRPGDADVVDRFRALRDQNGGAARIGIDVQRHFHAFGARAVYVGQREAALAPVAGHHALVVRQHGGAAGIAADGQHLVHGSLHLVALIADMAGVHRAARRGHARQAFQLGLLRHAAGLIGQAGAEAHGARRQRVGQHALHQVLLVGRGLRLGVAHGGQAQVGVAHQSRDVDHGLTQAQLVEVGAHAGEQRRLAQQGQRRRGVARQRRGRAAHAAIADHHRGDPLAGLPRQVRLFHEHQVVVPVHVDEARRHDLAAGVHAPRGRDGRKVADGRDALARHAHVGAPPGAAQAVDDPAAFDDQIQRVLPHDCPALMKALVSSARSIWKNCFY